MGGEHKTDSRGCRALRGAGAVWKRYIVLGFMLLLVWAPALITASMMSRYSVDIPVWDDLERAELLDRYAHGTLDFKFLASAHIEHRILLPRLIILANARFGNGAVRNEVWVNFAAMLISSICLAVLVWKTRPGRRSNWLLIFLMNLCVFSLLQYQNLCWAIQTAFFLPLTFLTLTLIVLRSPLRLPVKFVLAVLCALGGSASFAHGLALWPVVMLYFLFAGNDWSLKKRIWIVVCWGLIALAVGVFYFDGISSISHPGHSYLQEPGEHPPGFGHIRNGDLQVARVVHAFLLALGSHYSRFILLDPMQIAPWIGGFQLIVFVVLALAAVFRCIRTRSQKDWNNLLPWLALGGYAVVAVFLISLGRSNFGTGRALSPRYLTISLYLSVSLIALSALVILPMISSEKARARLRTAGYLLAGLFLVLQSWNWLYGYRGLQQWNAARWQSLSEHLFRDFSHTEHPTRLDFDMDYARDQIDRLQTLGYLHLPDPVGADGFERFTVSPYPVDVEDGNVIRVMSVDEPVSGWRITGFTDLQRHIGRVPDAMLFTIGDEAGRTIIGFAEPVPSPISYFMHQDFEFSDLNLPDPKSRNRWSGCIAGTHLSFRSEEPVEVTVWAVNLKKDRVYRHRETFTIYPGNKSRSNYDRPWEGLNTGKSFGGL